MGSTDESFLRAVDEPVAATTPLLDAVETCLQRAAPSFVDLASPFIAATDSKLHIEEGRLVPADERVATAIPRLDALETCFLHAAPSFVDLASPFIVATDSM